ncbi:aldehyde dehydrogenase EutE [Myxococcota bacterium]|nr:aldehyde dehydrogenase EutE [Myxococcota bacterium]MBU1411485.1 aldehyde dehydrogenase EutE [Myxococcota bacterium]MBU1509002.1 aldehyde dehydrogenase EutE [Myxococcota bacterium]
MAIQIDEQQLSKLVEAVLAQVKERGLMPNESADHPRSTPVQGPTGTTAPSANNAEGIFLSVDEAVAAARKAYVEFSSVSLERRKIFIQAMREAAIDNAEAFAREAVAETGFGRASDKIQKNLLAARKTPGTEDLLPMCYTGDDGLTLVEPAPFGVVGSITPCTNPAATIINNSISIVAAGNAVVFNPHPSAKGVTNHTVAVLNRAIAKAGGPGTLLCSLANPSLETSAAVMNHKDIRLLVVTGGGAVVKSAMTSGKRCIAAGPGNPPVIVDDTADISHAAWCIVNGASFDNNVLCTAEKEVFAFDSITDRLIAEMQRHGAYLIKGAQVEQITKVLVEPGDKYSHPNKKFVGQTAAVLLSTIGITVPDSVRLVICEVPDDSHPLVQVEMLMPILPIVRVKDLEEALSKAKSAEHGYRHSAYMHSESVSNMSLVAREIETTIFVKNAPSYAGLGFGGEGFSTLSIAGPTGEGLTSARSFTRQRRCVLAGAFRIV